MTHAEQVQQAKDALVQAAFKWYDARVDDQECVEVLAECVGAYRALLAATCPICGGRGEDFHEGFVPRCPAKCDNGRKRDE